MYLSVCVKVCVSERMCVCVCLHVRTVTCDLADDGPDLVCVDQPGPGPVVCHVRAAHFAAHVWMDIGHFSVDAQDAGARYRYSTSACVVRDQIFRSECTVR